MAKIIKLRKGLDIKLDGVAEKRIAEDAVCKDKPLTIGLVPDDFVGVKPQVMVKVGDEVSAGDVLFVNKQYPDVKFVSPINGTVTAVVRGERRKVMSVVVEGKGFVNENENENDTLRYDNDNVNRTTVQPHNRKTAKPYFLVYTIVFFILGVVWVLAHIKKNGFVTL